MRKNKLKYKSSSILYTNKPNLIIPNLIKCQDLTDYLRYTVEYGNKYKVGYMR